LRFRDPDGNLTEDLNGENGTIDKGDTLSGIAQKTGTAVNNLMAMNPSIKDKNKINAGGRIKLRSGPDLDVRSRSQWNARPAKTATMVASPGYNNATIHNSGRSGKTNPNDIQNMHIDDNGWDDVGYHFMVNPQGTVFMGRDLQYTGAHVANNNTGRIGILVMGDYESSAWKQFGDFSSDGQPPAAQLSAVFLLIDRLQQRYPLQTIGGHSDYGGGSDCPGDLLYPQINVIRRRTGLGGP
jgi:hypothetical protein